jgi:LysM repeat protein
MSLPSPTRRPAFAVLVTLVLLAVPSAAESAPSQAAAASGSATPRPAPEREWVKHRVVPNETIVEIAERYGVTPAEVRRWNAKALGDKQWIFAGQQLRVYARKTPPPRRKIRYEVQFGDTWQKIADRHGVTVKSLRQWNREVPRQFKAGAKLTIWTNPPPPRSNPGVEADGEGVEDEEEDLLADVSIPSGGWSVGTPNRGRLANGVALPESDLYSVANPDTAYGSTHAIEVLVESIARFRRESGYTGDLRVGAISKRGGGRYSPHRSHQSGRDIDIRLPLRPGASRKDPNPTAIDWTAAWVLIKAFAESGEVEYIFLSHDRQRRLADAAKKAGATAAELALIQHPHPAKSNHGLVRHAKGHTHHIHVRVKCGAAESRCTNR